MELIYAIAEYLDIPNEFITVDKAIGDMLWFHTSAGAKYSCRTTRGGKFLKSNSIRPD